LEGDGGEAGDEGWLTLARDASAEGRVLVAGAG